MFLLCVNVMLSCVGRDLCDGLIARPEESYRVSNCVRLRNLNTEEVKPQIWTVVKAVPLHAIQALGGRGGIAPTHSRCRH
jgi:hypothetical protein